MGSTDELQPNSGGLSPQNARKHSIEHVPALITMAVAGQRSEVLRPKPLVSEGIEHPLQSLLHSSGAKGRLGLLFPGNVLHQIPGTIPDGMVNFTTLHRVTPGASTAACPLGHGSARQFL